MNADPSYRWIFLAGGLIAGWLSATVWHSGDVEAGHRLPFVLRAYERRMSADQIAAARADMQSASDTAAECNDAQPEGSRYACEPANFLP